MRTLKSLWLMVAVTGLVAMMGARSFAGPLLPPFPAVWAPGQAVAGETTMHVTFGTADSLQIDWIVQAFDTNNDNVVDIWGYFYQIENKSGKTVSSFTIETPRAPFFFAGFTTDDIDSNFTAPPPGSGIVLGHVAGNYPNLGGPPQAPPPPETELAVGGVESADAFALSSDSVTWYFITPKLADNFESGLLFAYSSLPPMYGNASANNAGTSWGVVAGIPVPSPEPSTVVLVALGMLVGGVFMRRRFIS